MTALDAARTALAEGRWADIAAGLDEAAATEQAELEILAEARWWLGDVDGAIDAWSRAYDASLRKQVTADAGRLAAWMSLEYSATGNRAAATGWHARAAVHEAGAWTALAGSALADEAADRDQRAQRALADARAAHDSDLEIGALASVGLAHIRAGSFGDGLALFDEAMALATTGATTRLRTVGELCCNLVLATELTGDVQRFVGWMSVVEDFVARRGYPSVMGFCATCCGEAAVMSGDLGGAEQQLRAAVVSLHESGHTARCVPPTAKLAELLVLQGRLEEAEALLGEDDSEDALVARARLALARGDAALAAMLAARAARRLEGDTLVKVAAMALLVEARLAAGSLDDAASAADRLDQTARRTTSARAHARASITRGRLRVAKDDRDGAITCFEQALDEVAGVRGSVEAAEAHLEVARLQRDLAPDVATAEARAALAAFEAIGAARSADEAAALLRALGDHTRVGAKGIGLLTQREYEVLRLLAQGLSNAAIAKRLFISPKTAGNHVSSILSKLGLRSRAEAAAYAVIHGR